MEVVFFHLDVFFFFSGVVSWMAFLGEGLVMMDDGMRCIVMRRLV